MPFEIPYTFIAGQTAKAAEVNSNFLGVKQFVDLLEQNEAQNELDIATLEANKANINGNSSYRFQVADAINTMDAINLNTFNDLTANTKYYIGGFDLAKQSNTSIRATAGSCWDSTNTLMITSTGNLTLDVSTAGNDVTRYIYVCWNDDTQAAQLTFSSNSSTPSLPSGYTYYRLIGRFTTDSDGNIQSITKEGEEEYAAKLQTNGSYIFPGGLIINWGTLGGWNEPGNYYETQTVTFPTPFTTACLNVQTCNNCNVTAGDKGFYFPVQSMNRNSCVIRKVCESQNFPGGNISNLRCYWFAIGY